MNNEYIQTYYLKIQSTTVNLVRLTVDISYYQVHPQEHISITMDFKKIHILNYL